MRIELRKVYSQNFTKSKALVNRLIHKSNIGIDDVVLDIGAGKGIYSACLSKYAKRVVGIEIDKTLLPILKSGTESFENIEIVLCDFLNYVTPITPYKVFANIPFNQCGKIVKKLLFSANPPGSCYLALEYGFWKKYSGSPKETQVSLLLKPIYEMKVIHHFSKFDFEPASNVEIVFVEIIKRQKPVITESEYANYKDFIIYATSQSQWKPNIQKCLKEIFTYEQMKRLSKNIGFDMKGTPMDLNFEQWVKLFDYYNEHVIESKKVLIRGGHLTEVMDNDKSNAWNIAQKLQQKDR